MIIKILNKYSKNIEKLKKINEINSIILFGSKLKKTTSPLSDIDICILTKENLPENKKSEILSYGTNKFDINLFEDLPLPLQNKILQEGKIIFKKRDLSDLKRNIKHQWWDFKPKLERIYIKKGYPINI